MTDFTKTAPTEQSPVSGSSGVADPAGNSGVGAALANGIADVATIFTANRRATAASSSATQFNNKVVGHYLSKQQQLADMVEQDPSRLSEAQALSRTIYREYSASNPTASAALATAHKSYVEPSGLGPLVKDVGKTQRAQEKKRQEAFDEGFASPFDPPEKVDADIQRMIHVEGMEAELNSGRVKDRLEARQTVSRIAKGRTQMYVQSYQTISDNPDMTPEQKVSAIMQTSEKHIAGIQSIPLASEDQPLATATINALTSMRQIQVDTLQGKYTTETASALMKEMQIKMTWAFAQESPEAQAILIAGELKFRNPAAAATVDMSLALSDFVAAGLSESQGGSERPDTNIGALDNALFVNGLKTQVLTPSIADWRTGNLSEKGEADLNGVMNKMLRGAGSYAMTRSNPKENARAMSFFSDPKVGEYIVAHPEELGEMRQRASEMLGGTYRGQLMKVLENEVDNTERVSLEWRGGRAVFIGEDSLLGVVGLRKDASDLNKTASKTLTEYVKAAAHLEGTTDYNKWFNDNMATFVPNQVAEEQGDGAPVRGMVVNSEDGTPFVYLGGDPNNKESWAEAR